MNSSARNLGSASQLGQFPAELQNIIDHVQWTDIVNTFKTAESNALLISCGGEWCCCLITGFFCIFCCHPMINEAVAKQNLESIWMKLDTLTQFQSYQPYPPAVVTPYYPVDQKQQQQGVVNNPVYGQQSINVPIAQAQVIPVQQQQLPQQQPQQTRHAQFTVPQGLAPGSTVMTVSPLGTQITIVVPPDAPPGSIVTYAY